MTTFDFILLIGQFYYNKQKKKVFIARSPAVAGEGVKGRFDDGKFCLFRKDSGF
jgi:hypothetical protein